MKIVVLVIIVLLTNGAIPAKAEEVVSCVSLGLDPHVLDIPGHPGSGWLLNRYYIEEDGVGGLGCWVHKHPSGKGFVITPHSWKKHPTNAGKRGLVDGALQAMTDSRRTYSALGTFNSHLYFLLDDINYGAEMYWPREENNECWMEAGPKGGLGTWRSNKSEFYKGMLAHEIGHCFMHENLKDLGFSAATYTPSNSKWWFESAGDFLSGIVYPSLDFEHETAKEFDLDGAEFTQPYKANVLLTSYANSTNNRAVITLLRGIFFDTKNHPERLYFYLKSIGFDANYHDFVVDHYLGQVSDSGGGFIPRVTPVDYIYEITLEEGVHTLNIPALLPGRLNVVHLIIPQGMQATIQAPNVDGVSQSVVEGFELRQRNWTGQLVTQNFCAPDSVEILFSHLNEVPAKINLKYDLQPVDGSEGSLFNCDPCLVGSWHVNEEDYKKMIDDVVQQFSVRGMMDDVKDYTLDISKVDMSLIVDTDDNFVQHGRVNGKGIFNANMGHNTPVELTVALDYEDDAKGVMGGNPDSGLLDIGVTGSRHRDYGSYTKVVSPEVEEMLRSAPPGMLDTLQGSLNRPLEGQPMFVEGVHREKYECTGDTLFFPIEGQDGITLKVQFHRDL